MYYPTGGTNYTLGASIGSTDTTILLSSFLEPVSLTPYTMALIGSDIVYATISPQSDNSEFVSFTGITQNADGTATLTGVTRGLPRSPGTQVAGSTYRLPHAGQSIFILSDAPQVFVKYAAVANDNTFTGQNAFPAPTVSTSVATKGYVDGVAIAGAADASTSVKGIAKLSSAPGDVLGTVTITIASPAVATLASHGLIAGDTIKFTTTGTLPTGIVAGNTYFVISTGLTTNAFEFSTSNGGTAVNTSGSQSGTQTLTRITPVAVSDTDPRLPTQGENDALVGSSGTPSSSNKYVTQASTSATPLANGIPLLDATGYIPSVLTQYALLGTDATGVGPVTSSATETTVYTKALAANLFTTTSGLKIRVASSLKSTNSTSYAAINIKLNGTIVAQVQTLSGSGSAAAMLSTIYVLNNSSKSSQNIFVDNVSASGSYWQNSNTTSSVDTTSGITLTVTMKNSDASSSASWQYFNTILEKIGQ